MSEKNLTGGRTKSAVPNFGKRGWLVCIFCLLLWLLNILFDNGLNYIVPAFAAAHGWDPTILFSFTSIGGWIAVIGLIVGGLLLKKTSAKTVIMISLIGWIAGVLIWAFSTSIAMYGVGSILQKVFCTMFVYTGVGSVAANWFPTKKGLFMGWCTVGVTLGGMIANFTMPALTAIGGPVLCVGFFAIVGAIVLLFGAVVLKSTPEQAGCYPDNDKTMTPEMRDTILAEGRRFAETSAWTIGRCLRTGAVWKLVIIFGIFTFCATSFMSQAVIAGTGFGLNPVVLQLALAIGGIFSIIASIFGGVLDTKIGTKGATIFCMFFIAVAFVSASFAGHTMPGMVIAILMTSMGMSMANNMIVSLTSTIWGRYDFDTPYQVMVILEMLIGSFGYMVVSGMASATGSYKAPFALCLVLMVVAGLVTVSLNDKFRGRTDEDLVAAVKKN